MAIVHNVAKRKLRQGEIALGFGLHHLRSSAAPMLAGAARHDYLFMDMEHGAFTRAGGDADLHRLIVCRHRTDRARLRRRAR